jgi:hypothetical protein
MKAWTKGTASSSRAAPLGLMRALKRMRENRDLRI